MDTKKVAILSSVGILIVGAAVIGLIVWRSSQLAVPPGAGQPPGQQPPPGQTGSATNAPPGSGGGLAPGSATATGGTAANPNAPPQTTIDQAAAPSGCDVKEPTLDCDFDGLTNAQEIAAKTDPSNPDSDGDGVTDGGEVLTYKSDPLNAHSIDPSMTDLEAINAGKRDTRH